MQASWATRRCVTWLALLVTLVPLSASAQTTGGGNNQNQNPLSPFSQVGGVIVDADGVLRTQTFRDPGSQLTRERMKAAKAALGADLAKRSPLRKISLNRLEAQIRERLANGRQASDEMRYLAGMTRVQYVFFYPETNDIVLAGPAEPFVADMSGRVRGESGAPAMQLDDLIVALRTFFGPEAKQAPLISVSIDPTQEGLQNMQAFLRQIGSRAVPAQTQFIVNGLRESMGLNTVRLTGVPASSHFAQVLVEADYRMKLIGIGLEDPGVKMATYIDRASSRAASKNALQRWYFVPDYECVRLSDDQQAAELVGNGVKLVSADELVSADGTRKKSAGVDQASKAFTESFTKNYAAIARRAPVFTELRNIIDLSIAAALIKEHRFAEKAGWSMATFLDEGAYQVETHNVPKHVETTVAAVWKGNRLSTPVAGGVRIQPREALSVNNVQEDSDGKVAKAKAAVDLSGLKDDQWWWD